MTEFAIFINLFLSWFNWKIAGEYFEDDRNGLGYMFIFCSALCFASAIDTLTS